MPTTFAFYFLFIFKDLISLRESAGERVQAGEAAEGQEETGSLVSREPDSGFDPRTPRS